MELKSTRGISRLNYESTTDSWLVRYTTEGVTFNKLFSDGVYGSSELSLKAAEIFYEEIRTAFPPPTWEQFLDRSNKSESGIHGVRRQSARGGKGYASWMARWTLNGKVESRSFGVAKYGEEEAKQMAIDARKEVEPLLEAEYYANYWNYRPGKRFNRASIVEDPFAYEGAEKFILHRAAERDKNIRNLKLRAFLKEHGTLFCEICRFNFEETYGNLGKGLIEVHHTVPIAEMENDHRTTISELRCICSNCHFAVHNGDHEENLRLMRMIFNDVTRKRRAEQDFDPIRPIP